LALAGWEYDIGPVKSSASFKNTKLVTMCPMFLHVSINFKKEVFMSLGHNSYHILSFDPFTQFNGKL